MSENKVIWHSIEKKGFHLTIAMRCLFLCNHLLGINQKYLRQFGMVDSGLIPTKATTMSRKASLAKSTHK